MLETASRAGDERDGSRLSRLRFERGEEIPMTALPADIVLCLARGWAALEQRLPNGRRQYLDLYRPGDRLGSHLFADPAQRHRLVALTDAGTERRSVETSDDVRGSRVSDLAAFQRRLLRHVVRLGQMTAIERVVDLMLELHERDVAGGKPPGTQITALPLRQEQLADFLGMSAVHISRCLGVLRDQGLLRLRSGDAILDISGLSAVLMNPRANSNGVWPVVE